MNQDPRQAQAKPEPKEDASQTRTEGRRKPNQQLLLVLALLAACSSETGRRTAELPTGELAALRGTWLLVPEASRADTLVYRPNTYRFKFRKAGRPGFRLRDAGRFTRYDVAPGGGLLAHEGTWVSTSPIRLLIHLPDLEPAEPDYELELLAYHGKVLKLRRLSKRPAVEVVKNP